MIVRKSFGNEFYRGITTGFNAAFVIDDTLRNGLLEKDAKNAEILKPVLRGRDVSKYEIGYANLWLIDTFNGYFTTIADHQKEIIHKPDGITYLVQDGKEIKLDRMEWKSKSKLRYNRVIVEEDYPFIYEPLKQYEEILKKRDDVGDHWTNLRNCAFEYLFKEEKIIWGELSDKAKFALDTKGYYANNTIFFMVGKQLKYLLALLNSK